MSYLNPLLAFGFDKLASAAVKAGVCGFIIPDLPYDEGEDLRAALAPHGLALIQMVTPVTTPARMAKLCAATQGFVYAVTMTGTTGRTASVPGEVTRYLDEVTRRVQTTRVRRLRHSQPRAGGAAQADTWPASSSARRWSKCSRADRMPRRS